MIDKLIIDDAHIELTEKDTLPYTYQFSTAKTHTVKYALSDTDEIAASAFANCSYMTKIKFPEQIKMIKRRAFENCSRLNNVVIPKTIKYIGANVWDGCTGMTEMHFEHTNGESDPIPSNFAEIPAKCVVYIPNDSKYVRVEKDALGKNKDMNPDSVDYYTRTEWNQYEYVAPKDIKEDGTYYYDAWTSIAPNNRTIEEQNRIPVDAIEFELGTFIGKVGDKAIINYRILPDNATNRKLYFSTPDKVNSFTINDTTKEGEILITCNRVASSEITIHAESGANSTINISINSK